jgi:hypothetical protein
VSLARSLYVFAAVITLLLGTGMRSIALAPKQAVDIEQFYAPVDLKLTSVTWIRCGSWNGFYWRGSNRIALCEQNLDYGVPVARFILLHEMGHSFTMTRSFDFSHWDGNYEAAADEFAAVHSIARGHAGDLLKMAVVFEALGDTVHPDDPHPTGVARGRRLRDIYASYRAGGELWNELLGYWTDKIRNDPWNS